MNQQDDSNTNDTDDAQPTERKLTAPVRVREVAPKELEQ